MTSRIHDLIADCAEAEVRSRTAWDEPPELYFLSLNGGEPRLWPSSLPDEIWAMDRPPEVLAAIANTAAAFPGPVPDSLYGVGFRCESWYVTVPDDAAGKRQVDADARDHRLYTRPDRVEARVMYVVDRAGISYMCMLPRDGELIRQVSYPAPGDPAVQTGPLSGIAGAVPDALDALLRALLGVTLPTRPEGGWLR